MSGEGREFEFCDGTAGAACGGRDRGGRSAFHSSGGRVPGDSEFQHLTGGRGVRADHIGHAAEGRIGSEVQQLNSGADRQC